MTVFEAPGLHLSLFSSDHLRFAGEVDGERWYRVEGSAACGWTEITVRGRGWCVWPNREGEGFPLERVYPALRELGYANEGLSLSWPATASMVAVALFPEEGAGVCIENLTEEEGRHREMRIVADSPQEVRFRVTGPLGRWVVKPVAHRLRSTAYTPPPNLPRQYQVGIIDPWGGSHLHHEGGFRGLIALGERIMRHIPEATRPILHLFGYGQGHDRGYPDYTPAPHLGGRRALKEAVDALKGMGFRLSFYLNARLADREVLPRFPHLHEAVCRNADGTPVREEYFGRTLYVMRPDSLSWREELLRQARMVRELGADLIQLDQIAGRAATVPLGEAWGEGYNELIRAVKREGAEVWIQGVSTYYEADCFEMTWREVNILPGGVLRGGNPFGETDLTLLHAHAFSGTLLCPVEKLTRYGSSAFSFRADMMGERGSLPLYGPSYMEKIARATPPRR